MLFRVCFWPLRTWRIMARARLVAREKAKFLRLVWRSLVKRRHCKAWFAYASVRVERKKRADAHYRSYLMNEARLSVACWLDMTQQRRAARPRVARGPRPRDVHADDAAVELLVVEVLGAVLGLARLGEGHEGEAPGLVVRVHGQEDVRHLSEDAELVLDHRLVGAEREVADVDLAADLGLAVVALLLRRPGRPRPRPARRRGRGRRGLLVARRRLARRRGGLRGLRGLLRRRRRRLRGRGDVFHR